MNLWKYILLCALLSACGVGPFKKRHEDTPTTNPTDILVAKQKTYLALQTAIGDQYGYVHDKCDSVGFTSLCKSASGCAKADIFASEDNGRWYRSPSHDCFPGESATTISKDMFVMLFQYIWELGKTDKDRARGALERLEAYGKAHNWVMGDPSVTPDEISRVVLTPTLISLVYDMMDKLKLTQPTLGIFDDVGINKGFQAHLDILRIYLSGQVYGAINDIDMRVLKGQVEREPGNALFQAALHRFTDGDQSAAIALLLDETHFPSSKLPGSTEHCTEYLFERDSGGGDWAPCPAEAKTHSGTDFLFAAKMIIGG